MTHWHRILLTSLLAAGLAACADETAGTGSGASTTSASTQAASGTSDEAAPAPRGHHGPPAEALAACANLTAGAACSFTIHEHDVTGTCAAGPHDATALACRPEHGPGGPGMPGDGPMHGPPAEAVAACQSLAADAACHFTIHDHDVAGTCRQREASDPLVCAPDHHGGPPPSHP